MASWPPPEAARSVLDSVEHGVTLIRARDRAAHARLARGRGRSLRAKPVRSEGNLRSVNGEPRLTTLYSVGLSEGHDHDAVMRIGGRFRAAAPIYKCGTKCQGGHRRAATSDRLGSPQPAKQPSGAKL